MCEIPADRAFFQAGVACRDAGDANHAFVFLNRYLDITEAMDEGDVDSRGLDDVDFETEVYMANMLANTKALISPAASRRSTCCRLSSWWLSLSGWL